jgi:pyruvate formate-lyase/glycerol dehydratase family glycyl radical enzyme
MPAITLTDIALKDEIVNARVAGLKDAYFRALPEICIERSRLITEYSLKNRFFGKTRISVLDKAKMYRSVLENRVPVVRHDHAVEKGMVPFFFKDRSLFAGSTTGKFKGVPLYPEFLALSLWPELWSISHRVSNPYYLAEKDAAALNKDIFPYWIDDNITERARSRCFRENREKYGREKHAPEMDLLEKLVFFLASKTNCISHTIPDFSKAIKGGLRAIITEARRKAGEAGGIQEKEFFEAIGEALEGIIAYSKNCATEARMMADAEPDLAVKKELEEIAAINSHVPEFPARSFREGLTTIWICWTAIHLENPNVGLSLGRLDQVLYDLYRRDIAEKKMTISGAIELICCLWLKIGDHVPMIPNAGEQLFGGTGSNQAITLGGVDKEGNDAVNDLTYVMLRATELMRLRDPNLNARYYPGINSKDYLRRLCEVNVVTGATPALHNDRSVIEALVRKGETVEQARDYGIIGCVEPGSSGRSYGHSGALLMNLTSILELTLYNGRHRHTGMDRLISKETGDPAGFTTFQQFKNAFEAQADWLIGEAVTLNNILGTVHQDIYPTPILSSLFEGPMEKGRDLVFGGALINSSGAAIIGLADVADSLNAIGQLVYKEKTIAMPDLLKALADDFRGHDALRLRLQNPEKTRKFGNDDSEADATVSWIMRFFDSSFGGRKNYRGGNYRVGYWTMTNHAGFGRLTGALPNGRRAHENFSSGITPVSGVTPYLTKTLNSVKKHPPELASNGFALNIKYTPELTGGTGMIDNFAACCEGYFEGAGENGGGMEIQFNVTTHDTFVDAVNHPENYPELLVRVSGYTAYFKDLNPQMQREIIDRTEYMLSNGQAVYFEPFPSPEQTG